MKTQKIRHYINLYLREGAKNSVEILDYLNSKIKHGTSSHVLSNVLSKNRDLVNIGKERINKSGSSYCVCVWALKERRV